MKNIFNLNNPVWIFIGRLVDVFVLNILWFVCSIPIVTFGPATVALYYSMMKTVCDENPKYVRNFFKQMKANMANGIPLGLTMLVLGGLIVYAILFYSTNANYSDNLWILIFKYVMYGLGVLYVLMFQYVFALSARFVNTTFRTMRNALFLALQHFWWTIVMVFVTLLPAIILYMTNFLPILLLGFGLSVYINAYILNKILDPLIRKAKQEQGLETPEEEEERYTAEELAAASEWHMPASLASSGYTAAEEASEEAEETVSEAEETAAEVTEKAAEAAAEVTEKAAEAVTETAEKAAEGVTETVAETVEAAAEKAEETAGEADSASADPLE
ncbi:MAG: DUF624 domain-containing protein [Lachnospiraceae bacterium]|nr:DUF624 domain-containing protein [Lachnospiraceae bacterium]